MSYNNGLLNGIDSYTSDAQAKVDLTREYLRAAIDSLNSEEVTAALIDIENALSELDEL